MKHHLQTIIAAVCTAFLQADGQQTDLQLLVPAAQLEQLDSAVKARLADGFRERCEFSPSRMLKKGFKLTFKGQDVVYDFSDEALTAALSEHLSPKLAAILADSQA